ncbi:phytanoyl-CoA dioxygenase family protein [Pedosphaera parvula]|uniref:Phytanoyl-CoA dioxygenase n=1 Tax=Pedosphaera parvula (strain Ellin514) TaxID=320771 RepID=B9XNR7_PEDPL|nr:phytanoyl-CoA dioxygenase family protein [Pedosphaera parvula]EEF58490.1 Phytanoyl-CoA dioxygenase [Pedosphaera parvula Ellin514]
MNWIENLEQNGYAILEDIVSPETVATLVHAIESLKNPAKSKGLYAMRNLMEEVSAVRQLADSPPIRNLVEPILGKSAFPVRSLLFDKTPDANWKVAWHQDLSIAVNTRVDLEGFGPWSTKAGVLHVQPPTSILEQMVTVRLHLDDCGLENGPLQVLPGSHTQGKLDAKQITNQRKHTPAVPCTVKSGGVVLMRPLILHASSTATKPGHRRVIHLEFASAPLPHGLAWAFQEHS